MKHRLTILLDMDNTLNDFYKTYINYYNKLYKKNLKLEKEDLIHYNIAKSIKNGIDKNIDEVNSEIFSFDQFWSDMKLFDEHTYEVVEYLNENHNVYIATVPFKGHDNCAKEKIKWVRKNLPFFDTSKIIFARNKGMINADLLIDDAVEHLTSFQGEKIVIDFPYNREIDSKFRVNSWREILEIFKKGDL